MLNLNKKTDIKQRLDAYGVAWVVSQEGRDILEFSIDIYGETAHQQALDWVAREYKTPRKGRGPHTLEEFEALRPCRVFSPCGPCLTGYRFVRENKKSVTVAFRNGRHIDIKRVHSVHFERCPSCSGGSRYPNGYMD